jgi:hypothetical protein
MQYIILEAKSSAKLAMQVDQWIPEGWIPQGGVTLAIDQGNYTYCQAMVKP